MRGTPPPGKYPWDACRLNARGSPYEREYGGTGLLKPGGSKPSLCRCYRLRLVNGQVPDVSAQPVPLVGINRKTLTAVRLEATSQTGRVH